jgi:hypothetical protein
MVMTIANAYDQSEAHVPELLSLAAVLVKTVTVSSKNLERRFTWQICYASSTQNDDLASLPT